MNRYTRIATILALLLAPPCWAADDAGTIALTIHYANRNGIIGESKLLITVPENATIQEVKDEIVKKDRRPKS